jgi:hypothetical protein
MGVKSVSLTLREEHLRGMFEPRKGEVAGVREDCIMRSFITFSLIKCYQDNQIEEYEMGGACSTHGKIGSVYSILVGKHEGKRPLGKSKHSGEYNIRLYPREIAWVGVDWIPLAQDGY